MSNILEVIYLRNQANRTQTEEMLQADLIAWSASISACAGRGQWQHALYLMSEMQRHLVLPNIVSCMAESVGWVVMTGKNRITFTEHVANDSIMYRVEMGGSLCRQC